MLSPSLPLWWECTHQSLCLRGMANTATSKLPVKVFLFKEYPNIIGSLKQ
jgi:hypothetical protein